MEILTIKTWCKHPTKCEVRLKHGLESGGTKLDRINHRPPKRFDRVRSHYVTTITGLTLILQAKNKASFIYQPTHVA